MSESVHSCSFISTFSYPASILFFSFCSELEEMADGTLVQVIHCGSVSSEFIFSLVCRGRHRTGCCRTKAYNRLLQRHLEDTDSSVRQGACGQVSGHNGSLTDIHMHRCTHTSAQTKGTERKHTCQLNQLQAFIEIL